MSKLSRFGVRSREDSHFEEVIYGLALVYNIMNNHLSNFLKEFHLSPGKFNILLTVKHQGKQEGISQVDISKHLIVTPSNMTKLIDKLEKEGLVSRSAMENDRRVNIINITPEGSSLLDQVWPGYQSRLKALVSGLTDEKQKKLAGLLLEWFEHLSP
ncbi:MAG: MarR family transcriptional regulator [Candidatus Omnitrophica bacterium]|nr:MarR family transcriptional regulator [Candidatus Omnitrophota bacterium]